MTRIFRLLEPDWEYVVLWYYDTGLNMNAVHNSERFYFLVL